MLKVRYICYVRFMRPTDLESVPHPSTPRTIISTKVEVNIITSCNVFAAGTLRDLMTLISDLLTMNSCHASCRSHDELHHKIGTF